MTPAEFQERLIADRIAARTADEALAAEARALYYNHVVAKAKGTNKQPTVADLTCPKKLIPTEGDIIDWLPNAPIGALEVHLADRRHGRWHVDTIGAINRYYNSEADPAYDRTLLIVAVAPEANSRDHLDVHLRTMEDVLELWRIAHHNALIEGCKPPPHPLSTLVDAWQRRPASVSAAKVRVAHGAARFPYAASEALRRNWKSRSEVTAVEVDGEPLAARIRDLPMPAYGVWVYYDGTPLFGAPAQLYLPDPTMSAYPRDARDAPLTMVAAKLLGDLDHRSSLRNDIRILLTAIYASNREVLWSDFEGAKLLSRTKDGLSRTPEMSDKRRWRNACDVVDSTRLWYRDRVGMDWVRLATIDPIGFGRRVTKPPAWWFRRGNADEIGFGMGYTLTGANHQARQVGEKFRTYVDLVNAAEYWLARSYDGNRGVAVLLRPEKAGGPGPWVRMRWDEVMEVLVLDRMDENKDKQQERIKAGRRYWSMVDGLKAAGYVLNATTTDGTRIPQNSDLVEFEVSSKRGGSAVAWLQFRATARFCEAAKQAERGKWESMPMLQWFGVA